MSEQTSDIFIDGMCFPESPRWHNSRLYFVDMYEGQIWSVAPGGQPELVLQWHNYVSGLGWLPDGDLLFVDMCNRCVMRVVHGRVVLHSDLGALAAGKCNDMVVDRCGRAYVGNFGYDIFAGEHFQKTPLIMVSTQGKAVHCSEPLAFPNGMVVSPCGDYLLVAETTSRRIVKFTIEKNGSLSNRRVLIKLDRGWPDGICLDRAGAVWVAAVGEQAVLKINADGEVERRLPTRRQAYACMLGGDNGRCLFVATAPGSSGDITDPKAFYRRQRLGCIECFTVDEEHAGCP